MSIIDRLKDPYKWTPVMILAYKVIVRLVQIAHWPRYHYRKLSDRWYIRRHRL